mmetsp:Transcript_148828/g.262851  ORF Transcript_148828/g.262851 Transcript_148828/m.262851 type:complete len:308 (+) Transcript_148828:248-1171(+)
MNAPSSSWGCMLHLCVHGQLAHLGLLQHSRQDAATAVCKGVLQIGAVDAQSPLQGSLRLRPLSFNAACGMHLDASTSRQRSLEANVCLALGVVSCLISQDESVFDHAKSREPLDQLILTRDRLWQTPQEDLPIVLAGRHLWLTHHGQLIDEHSVRCANILLTDHLTLENEPFIRALDAHLLVVQAFDCSSHPLGALQLHLCSSPDRVFYKAQRCGTTVCLEQLQHVPLLPALWESLEEDAAPHEVVRIVIILLLLLLHLLLCMSRHLRRALAIQRLSLCVLIVSRDCRMRSFCDRLSSQLLILWLLG